MKKIVVSLVFIAAIVVIGESFLLLRYQPKTPATSTLNQPPSTSTTTTTTPSSSQLKTYQDPKGYFTFNYPSYLSVGSQAPNSTLGSYDVPVPGVFVGNDVWVVADTPELKQAAEHFFHTLYDSAWASTAEADKAIQQDNGPSAECVKSTYPNPSTSILSVTCYHEGGGIYYFVTNGNIDIFIDGASEGYAEQYHQTAPDGFKSDDDLKTLLASLRFTSK